MTGFYGHIAIVERKFNGGIGLHSMPEEVARYFQSIMEGSCDYDVDCHCTELYINYAAELVENLKKRLLVASDKEDFKLKDYEFNLGESERAFIENVIKEFTKKINAGLNEFTIVWF